MKIYKITSLFILITAVVSSLLASTPHGVIGTLQYEDGSFPAQIDWSAYITARPDEVLDFDKPSMYDSTTGGFLIQCSSFSNWAADETLHVDFSDTQNSYASIDVVLSYDAYDNAGVVELAEKASVIHRVLGNVVYENGNIPSAIQWSAFITTHPELVLTSTDTSNYDDQTGEFVLYCEAPLTGSAGDTLQINVDDTQDASGSTQVVLTENDTDSAGSIVLYFPSNIGGDAAKPVDDIELLQNYPNPFNPETIIMFKVDRAQHIQLTVFSALGKRVRTLNSEYKNAGVYKTVWDGKNDSGDKLSSGAYFLELKGESLVKRSKAIMIR